MSFRICCYPGFAALLVALTLPAAGAADDVDPFLEGLRQRRLFQLAETYCRQRLADAQAPPGEAARLTVELIRIYAEQATHAAADARQPLWQQARETAQRFAADHPAHPRLVLVRVQDALTMLAQGELARLEAEIGADREASLDTARTMIRQAARLLEQIDQQLATAIAQAPRRGDGDRLSAGQLTSLQHNVRYQLARAFRNQALSYPPASSDRLAALTQALEQLAKPLPQLPADDELATRIKIDQAVCRRLLDDLDAARRVVRDLDNPALPAATRLRARAEAVRVELAAGDHRKALETLARGRTIGGVTSPELDFAHLETYVALWQAAAGQEAEAAQRWERQAVATLDFIEQTHGPYWSRRAELLLIGAGRAGRSGNLDILTRAARDLYRKGQLDDALAAYDQAAAAAGDAGNDAQAFELAYKAALIQQQRGRHEDARDRFARLAGSLPDYPLAHSAHLMAAVNTAELVAEDPAQADEYARLLDEHIRTWPQRETADTARLWLGELRESQRRWPQALAVLRDVAPASEHFAEAVLASARCWSAQLAALRADGQATAAAASEAAAYFDQVVYGPEKQWPAPWSDLQRQCASTSARFRLLYTTDAAAAAAAERLLRAALAEADDAPAAWQAEARSLLLLALLGQAGREEEAERLLAQIAGASTTQLLDLLDGIGRVADGSAAASSRVAPLQVNIAARLLASAGALDADQRLRVQWTQAAALAALGKTREALDRYAQLVQQHPRQGALHAAYAELLLAADDRPSLQQALTQWRQIARKTRPRSERWFRAKYSVALAHFKLGDKLAAAKLIRYLQVTEDLSSSGLEEEFAALLKQCGE